MLSRRSALLAAPALLLTAESMANSGIFDDRIVFGQAAPLDGPAAALGTGMRDGILAARRHLDMSPSSSTPPPSQPQQ